MLSRVVEVSTQQPKNPKTRAGGFRVRTGCTTCKIRHVKCDEQRPSCTRCVSTGRTCDGYPERPDPRQKALRAVCNPPFPLLASLSASILGTSSEKSCFDVFRSRTAPELSRVMMIDIWRHDLLQACQVFDAMRHASIAIGSIVRCYEISCFVPRSNDEAIVNQNFATLHYYKAIKCLRSQICASSPPPLQYTLMCCLLFLCFEFLCGNDSGALAHLRHGLKIVWNLERTSYGLKSHPDSQTLEFWEKISWIFSTLDAQLSLWLCLPYSKTLWLNDISEMMIQPPESEFFTDVEIADRSLRDLWGWKCDIQRQYADKMVIGLVTAEMNDMKMSLLNQLERWLTMMNVSVSRWHREEESWINHRIAVLYINHKIIFIEAGLVLERTPNICFQTLESDFQDVIRLCSILLEDPKARNRLVSGSRVGLSLEFDAVGLFLFTITTGIIRALYYTAVHSTSDETSRKAIEFLTKSSWREAAWESTTIARIAQKRRFGK